jgi:hypothetical protein
MTHCEEHREEYRGWTIEVFRTHPGARFLVGIGSRESASVQCRGYVDDDAQTVAAEVRRLVDQRLGTPNATAA